MGGSLERSQGISQLASLVASQTSQAKSQLGSLERSQGISQPAGLAASQASLERNQERSQARNQARNQAKNLVASQVVQISLMGQTNQVESQVVERSPLGSQVESRMASQTIKKKNRPSHIL